MRVAAVMTDLMLYSRIDSVAIAAGATLIRIDTPSALPDDLDLVLVDWSTRQADWADALRARTATRVILVGQHTDLEAHAAARAAGLGPMWARSKLLASIAEILAAPTFAVRFPDR